MAKFTMVEGSKIGAAIEKMVSEAAKKLEIKDLETVRAQELAKVRDASKAAQIKFVDANEKKKTDDKTKLYDDKLSEAIDAEKKKAVEAELKKINPLVAFEENVTAALQTLEAKADEKTGEVKEEDFNAFKKALHAAHFDCVQAYKKEGNKSAYEYMLNAGKLLIGAIVAIIASPVLLFSADRRSQLVETFFSGTHSDKSRSVQAALEENAETYVTCAK